MMVPDNFVIQGFRLIRDVRWPLPLHNGNLLHEFPFLFDYLFSSSIWVDHRGGMPDLYWTQFLYVYLDVWNDSEALKNFKSADALDDLSHRLRFTEGPLDPVVTDVFNVFTLIAFKKLVEIIELEVQTGGEPNRKPGFSCPRPAIDAYSDTVEPSDGILKLLYESIWVPNRLHEGAALLDL